MDTIKKTIREHIQKREWKLLKTFLNQLNAVELAQILEYMSEKEGIIVFRLLTRKQSKDVFKLLSHLKQEEIIEGLSQNTPKLINLLNDIEPDDRTAFFEELPGKVVQRLMQLLSPEERDISIRLLGYPEDSIGRLMTTKYIAVKPDDTVEHAFEHIRKFGREIDKIDFIYVVDRDWKLIDEIPLKDLIIAPLYQNISGLMDKQYIALNVYDDQETAVKKFKDYDRTAIPVVNYEGVLLGIITVDDIIDVAEEESTEDFHKFGSVRLKIDNPLQASLFILYRKRIVWLIALVFMNVFSGAAIASFEEVIQSIVSLVFFLPLLIDSGGNAGSQSATLMIRALAIGDVKLSDWWKLIGKELIVSFTLGLTMGLGVALVTLFRSPEIIFVVSITMVLTVMVGSIVGMLLPFIFTAVKLDPATASAPLITSLADICGVLIYFSIASCYFGF